MRTLIAYFKLIRLPNVFTALADIIAGYFLAVRFTLSEARWEAFALACGASAALYLAGMAFNDVADREEDARVRPGRPIPSGAVSLGGAVVCALGMMVLGLGLAFGLGPVSLVVAGGLAAFILAYDFVCKGTFAGPMALGWCRFSNVLLGISAVHSMPGAKPMYAILQAQESFMIFAPLIPAALASGFFGAGVTAFSAQEEAGANRRAVIVGWLYAGLGLLIAASLFAQFFSSGWAKLSVLGFLPLGLLAWQLISRTRALMKEGTPQAAQGLVLAGVKGYCLLDAAMLLLAFGVDVWGAALAAVVMLFPGGWLRKWLMQREA